jgi:uncharacterized membrane protein
MPCAFLFPLGWRFAQFLGSFFCGLTGVCDVVLGFLFFLVATGWPKITYRKKELTPLSSFCVERKKVLGGISSFFFHFFCM